VTVACHALASLPPALVMGRTKARTKRVERKQHVASDPHVSVTNSGPSSSALYEKAQHLVEQCDYELATKFLKRIVDNDNTHSQAQELLGVVLLELGDLSNAEKVSRTFHTLPVLKLHI